MLGTKIVAFVLKYELKFKAASLTATVKHTTIFKCTLVVPPKESIKTEDFLCSDDEG
jgi:hypothetical protein